MAAGTIEDTLEHALFLAEHLHNCELQYVLIAILLELKIPTKSLGYDYLESSIQRFCDDPMQAITKELYLQAGYEQKANSDARAVENAIRRAIDVAWKKRDEEIWRCFFPTLIDRNGKLKKPSNAEFISGIGRFLVLWQGCCKEVSYGRK